jgi:ATP-dependent RNA helicase DHX29
LTKPHVTAALFNIVYVSAALLRRLASDPLLSGVTHVVVDEVHERSLQGDVLMALLQRIAAARNAAADAAGNTLSSSSSSNLTNLVPQRLKVVLMSATLDANIYSSYYWGCPVLSCPGRTFPVTVRYLEDCYAETRCAEVLNCMICVT